MNYRQLLSFFFESVPICTAVLDFEGKFVSVNQKMADLLGYCKDEMYKIRFQDITSSLFLTPSLFNFQKLRDGGIDSYQMEKTLLKKSGESCEVNVNVHTYLSDDGGRTLFCCYCQESTLFYKRYLSRFNTEIQWENNEEGSIGMILSNESGKLLYGNRMAGDFLGYTEKELENQFLGNLIDYEKANNLLSVIRLIPRDNPLKGKLNFYSQYEHYIEVETRILVDMTERFYSGPILILILELKKNNRELLESNCHQSQDSTVLSELKNITHLLKGVLKENSNKTPVNSEINLFNYGVTNKEKEVLLRFLDRKSAKEIASSLGLAEVTIRKHLTSLYRKFGVSNREELLLFFHGREFI